MKKLIVFIVTAMFVVSAAGLVLAQRSLDEERDAVRAYLKVVDTKIINYRKAGNKGKVSLLQTEKQATLARWYKLKNLMEKPAVVTPTPPPPVVVNPPAPVVNIPSPPPGLFGIGVPTALTGLYINTGKGNYSGTGGIKGEVILDDFTGLDNLLGLSPKAIKYKLGVGVVAGGGGGLKGIPVYAGGTIALPMMGGVEPYLVGGLNYVVYGNGKTSGKIGGDAGVGFKVDFGFGLGKTGLELGWGVVRSNNVTSKGVMFSVSQPILL